MNRKLKDYLDILLWYKKKHGFVKLVILFFSKAWRRINNKEAVFLFDLDFPITFYDPRSTRVSVYSYDSVESIPPADRNKLIELKSSAVLHRFLNSFYRRNAIFWLAKINDDIVGVHWTLLGGFNGFYSLPILKRDTIVLAVEVFPKFRGQNIWPEILNNTISHLKKGGISRVYIKVSVFNKPMLKSMNKIQCLKIGTVRTFQIFNRHITIWDK